MESISKDKTLVFSKIVEWIKNKTQSNSVEFRFSCRIARCFMRLPMYEVQETADRRMEVIMAGLLEKNQAPDKEMDAMAWAGHMNLLKVMAEEVVVRELIYT